jgi:hypothetical protein
MTAMLSSGAITRARDRGPCHIPGAFTVSGGNSRVQHPAPPAHTSALLTPVQGDRPYKLVMRVRFPSPAPMCSPRSEGTRTVVAMLWRPFSMASRVIGVPLSPRGAAVAESLYHVLYHRS